MDARDGDDVEAFGTLPDVFANALEIIIDHRRISTYLHKYLNKGA